MTSKNLFYLFIGIILLFFALYGFTRPIIFDSWDFTNTGQIGDTIGGITSPIIGLFGAYLVYITFEAQIAANKIQSDALKQQIEEFQEEKKNQAIADLYQRHVILFDEIKNHLKNLEFIVEFYPNYVGNNAVQAPHVIFKGLNALEEYVNRLEDIKAKSSKYYNQRFSMYGAFLNFKFMFDSINGFIDSVDLNISNNADKAFFIDSTKLFYLSFLMKFVDRIIDCYEPNVQDIMDLNLLKNSIETKLNIKPLQTTE